VQPFKKGPDYIDPSWLSAASGRACRTLDPFFQPSDDALRRAYLRGVEGADLAVIEGNHGLFDSVPEDGSGSCAAVARILGAPILLVINAVRMGRSAAALVHGCQTFETETPIAGVVLNNIAGNRHETKVRSAIEMYCDIPVVGAIPRNRSVVIPDRHLGLIPHVEDNSLHPAIEACREAVETHIDLEAVQEMSIAYKPFTLLDGPVPLAGLPDPGIRPVLGVIRDRAFSFYYPENLEALERSGARLVFVNSLHDSTLPDLDTLYIGGGFPEMFLDELETNHNLRREIRAAVDGGLPVYAECGGLMYLSKRIHWVGRSGEMVGALPIEVEVSERPQGHGYVQAEVATLNPFWLIGTTLRGHEFHNSRLTNLNGVGSAAYRLARGSGLGNGQDGLVYHNVLASYTHLHADGSPGWADGLVTRARQFAQERRNG
jgi:cobyrinic acid a,c-diamide synthase